MSREIKFRGLRVDGKGWVYGAYRYSHLEEETQISFVNGLNDDDWHTVRSESVGQFTGLTHKKEGELYIGDKVRVFGEEEYSCEQFSMGDNWSIEGEVCEMDFMIGVNFGMFGFMPLAVIQEGDMDFEIIGNIHKEEEGK